MKRIKNFIFPVICCLVVMYIAAVVRVPAAYLYNVPADIRDDFRDEKGEVYFMEMDSYYHARLTDNYLKYGTMADSVSKDGVPWDSRRHYPGGRNALYQPGIVWLTAAAYRVLNLFGSVDLHTVEFWLSVFMAAVSGMAAFWLVTRMSNLFGGLVGGILVSCSIVYTERTLPGRYDTDMFVVLMDVLLIICLTEALRRQAVPKRIAAGAGFILTIIGYSLCWTRYSLLLGILTFAGGALYLIVNYLFLKPGQMTAGTVSGQMTAGAASGQETADTASGQMTAGTASGQETADAASGQMTSGAAPQQMNPDGRPASGKKNFWRQTEVKVFILGMGIALGALLLFKGPTYFTKLISNLIPGKAGTSGDIVPDVFSSVIELKVPELVPKKFGQWFLAYVPGKMFTVLNGIGGLAVVVLCIGALIMLLCRVVFKRVGHDLTLPDRSASALYFFVLLAWLVGCLLAVQRGVRFVEHLAVPAGILAGAFIGWVVPQNKDGSIFKRAACGALSLLMCAAAVIIPVSGALEVGASVNPGVSDASAAAMNWIKNNARDPDAVIASWWDMGYYYQYESGHPTFWDGGSQTATRALLISKILAGKDPALSQKALLMMAAKGNSAVEYLAERLGQEKAFKALWKVLLLSHEETRRVLEEDYLLSPEDALEVEEKIHPPEEKEVYLVLTKEMMNMLGWIEYYANWDFTGRAKTPYATVYSVVPDGSARMGSDNEEVKAFFRARSQELIWKLYFDGEGQQEFFKVFEASDHVTNIQIWKMNSCQEGYDNNEK